MELKIKGKQMKKQIKGIKQFDLERLKGKKVAVNCKTEEQAQDFVNWVNSLGVALTKETFWKDYKENSCYILRNTLSWEYCYKEYYKDRSYEIISYEEALLKESKDELPKQNSKPTIREEFIQKVQTEQTEKIGVICSTLEELEIWYTFLDEHMDKSLRRPPKEWIISEEKFKKVIANNTEYGNIIEWNSNDGFYEDEGYEVYNFKDIIYQESSDEVLSGVDSEQNNSEVKPQENYLVYVKGKGQPKVRHTYENAIKEAQRLSTKEIGKEVNVVKVLKTFKSEVIVNEIEGEK